MTQHSCIEDLYDFISTLGAGSYGQVYKARNRSTGEIVAIKRIKSIKQEEGFPRTALREMISLRALHSASNQNSENINSSTICENHIVSLKEVITSERNQVYLIFNYLEFDLNGIITSPSIPALFTSQVRSYMRQLLIGLRTIHCAGFIHRDIKPANILISKSNILKIGDFGLARVYNGPNDRPFTNRVITLWYRAPELLLGETKYGPEVDIWSLGCTFYEMMTGKPLFVGHTEVEQLNSILKIFGLPSETEWPAMNSLPNAKLFHFNTPKKNNEGTTTTTAVSKFERFLDDTLPIEFQGAKNILMKMLALNPMKRISVKDVFLDPYFTDEAGLLSAEKLPRLEYEETHSECRKNKKKMATNNREMVRELRPPRIEPPLVFAD